MHPPYKLNLVFCLSLKLIDWLKSKIINQISFKETIFLMRIFINWIYNLLQCLVVFLLFLEETRPSGKLSNLKKKASKEQIIFLQMTTKNKELSDGSGKTDPNNPYLNPHSAPASWTRFHSPLLVRQLRQLPTGIRAQIDNLQYLNVEALKTLTFRESTDIYDQLRSMQEAAEKQERRIESVTHPNHPIEIEQIQQQAQNVQSPRLQLMLFKDKNHSILDPPLNLLDMQQFDFKDANQSGNRYVDADEFMLLQ